jgi:4-hydroxy-4-methyl-2-oxoglutarate aldolase
MAEVTPEVLENLRKVRPADAADALDSLGYVDTYSMDVSMRPLAYGQRMVGLAQTFQLVPSDRVAAWMSYEDYASQIRELADGWNRFEQMFGPGGVSVIDANGSRAGVLGSANTLKGKIEGMQGYVIDGACRDSYETILQKIPVWCTVRSFSRVEWRIKFGQMNEEIVCAGVRVRPGDVVMGDDDGVLVVPAELAGEVAERALDILERDKRARRRMYERLGISLDETVQ